MPKNTNKTKRGKNPARTNAAPPARHGGARAPKMALLFPPAGQIEGLTNSATSQFSDKNAASCVRELIQNSLDAALVDLKQTTAKIRFAIAQLPRDKIPGMPQYERALRAIVSAGNDNKQTENVRDAIQDGYAQTDALFVTDNGIGLNAQGLAAILSDGKSHKGNEGASGSWGNGHLTTFALSHLRYLFYGAALPAA